MSTDLNTIPPAWSPEQPSWLRRLGRSNAFTISLSVLVHGAAFLAFYQMTFRKESKPHREIVPEARLVPRSGATTVQPAQMPRLSPQPAPAPDDDRPAELPRTLPLSEMPLLAANLTGGPDAVAPEMPQDRPSKAAPSLLGPTYASGGAGPVGPATSFFGVAGNAYKVVYMIDVSNSLMITLDRQIAAEMKRAIRDLTASQQFHIILATPVRVIEFAPGRLVYATGANKQAAIEFIEKNIRPTQDRGVHAPVEGLRRAFDTGAELVYFLSDGDFFLEEEREALKKLVAEKSQHGEIKLTTLGFGSGDQGLLEQLAKQTGGNFRYTDYQ